MQVLIVGAGPCGLLLALFLQKQGIQTQVLDASDKLDDKPRATHYGGPSKYELERAGVLDQVTAEGFHPDAISWRRKDGSCIVKFDSIDEPESSVYRMVCLPLNRVIQILRDAAVKHGCEVLMQHQVTPSIGQSSEKAWVDVMIPSGEIKRFEADYIVGCDGANSRIRRSLYGDWEFPGRTWDQQIIASNVYYPFEKFGYDDSNFIVDQNDWYMAAKIAKDGLWRVTYGEVPGLTLAQYTERLPARFKEMFPWHVEASDIKIANVGPYRMHQRLAPGLRSGRFLLAGDAAHLCNPFGGLGLTGGIADVGALQDALVGMHKGLADDSILDKYSEIRSEKYRTIVDPISSANFRRLWEKDPESTIAEDEFFALLQKASKDKDLLRQIREKAMDLQSDLTVFYRQESTKTLNDNAVQVSQATVAA